MTTATSWLGLPHVSFDTETTGVDVSRDRIVTAAQVVAVPGGEVEATKHWLLDPGIEIPAGATSVHGISTAHAREHGQVARAGLDEIAQALAGHALGGAPVVVFNAAYDLTLLDNNLRHHGLATLSERLQGAPLHVIDPLVLDRAFDRYRRGKRTLGVLAEVYGIDIEDALHDAAADATVTLHVLARIAAKFPELGEQSLTDLQSFQHTAHREWAQNFNQWREGQGFSGPGASEEWLPA
ncbi:exonuclease domain-containing protein [Rarobacter faecitabidus]|uniref:DNA polymerase-3 subunit epsilon n=1 Tax=Rarobacter faecitabidus TaxID=13243 RepID=A0A542ZXU1_RARFA|nr:exonuclease domain-containing protein [Rarobacter faecitabidus]TQL65030.1 DNA polymerase-3 subunit epsilon [Rarobacter faecitabidus]